MKRLTTAAMWLVCFVLWMAEEFAFALTATAIPEP